MNVYKKSILVLRFCEIAITGVLLNTVIQAMPLFENNELILLPILAGQIALLEGSLIPIINGMDDSDGCEE